MWACRDKIRERAYGNRGDSGGSSWAVVATGDVASRHREFVGVMLCWWVGGLSVVSGSQSGEKLTWLRVVINDVAER